MTDPGYESETFTHADGGPCPETGDASPITLDVPIVKPDGWTVTCGACGQELAQAVQAVPDAPDGGT